MTSARDGTRVRVLPALNGYLCVCLLLVGAWLARATSGISAAVHLNDAQFYVALGRREILAQLCQ